MFLYLCIVDVQLNDKHVSSVPVVFSFVSVYMRYFHIDPICFCRQIVMIDHINVYPCRLCACLSVLWWIDIDKPLSVYPEISAALSSFIIWLLIWISLCSHSIDIRMMKRVLEPIIIHIVLIISIVNLPCCTSSRD